MRSLLSLIFILAWCSQLLADDAKEPDYTFKSKKALAAVKKFEAANDKVEKASNKEKEKAEKADAKQKKKNRVELILALEKELRAETKAGNLDEAIEIRDAIAKLKKGNGP